MRSMYFNVLVQTNAEGRQIGNLAHAASKEEAIKTCGGREWEPYYIEAKSEEEGLSIMWDAGQGMKLEGIIYPA